MCHAHESQEVSDTTIDTSTLPHQKFLGCCLVRLPIRDLNYTVVSHLTPCAAPPACKNGTVGVSLIRVLPCCIPPRDQPGQNHCYRSQWPFTVSVTALHCNTQRDPVVIRSYHVLPARSVADKTSSRATILLQARRFGFAILITFHWYTSRHVHVTWLTIAIRPASGPFVGLRILNLYLGLHLGFIHIYIGLGPACCAGRSESGGKSALGLK
jgi:hypothetical protein